MAGEVLEGAVPLAVLPFDRCLEHDGAVVAGAGERRVYVGDADPDEVGDPAWLRGAPLAAGVGDDHGTVVADGQLGPMALADPRALGKAEGGAQEGHRGAHVGVDEDRHDRRLAAPSGCSSWVFLSVCACRRPRSERPPDLPVVAEWVHDPAEQPAVDLGYRVDLASAAASARPTAAAGSSTTSSSRVVAPPRVWGLKFPCSGDSSSTQNRVEPTWSCATTSGSSPVPPMAEARLRPEGSFVERHGLAPMADRQLDLDARHYRGMAARCYAHRVLLDVGTIR